MRAKVHHKLLDIFFSVITKKGASLPKPPIPVTGVRDILLINTTAIGDTLVSTPAIRAIRKAFPRARITSLVSRESEPVLRRNPNIDRLILYPGRINFRYLLRLPGFLRELKAGRFDMCVAMHANDPDIGPLMYLTGARYRAGWKESRFNYLFTAAEPRTGCHIIQRQFRNLKAMGIRSAERLKMDLDFSQEDFAATTDILSASQKEGKRLIALHPFSRDFNKWWPPEQAEGFCRLARESNMQVVIIGGEKEAAVADELADKTGAISAAGRLPLLASAALISQCSLLVTTDSGPMHMAQALDIPVIALFGPTDPALSGPVMAHDIVLGKKIKCSPCNMKKCQYPMPRCMYSISPEEAMQAVLSKLPSRAAL